VLQDHLDIIDRRRARRGRFLFRRRSRRVWSLPDVGHLLNWEGPDALIQGVTSRRSPGGGTPRMDPIAPAMLRRVHSDAYSQDTGQRRNTINEHSAQVRAYFRRIGTGLESP
jgi:hypothetical protein